MMKPFLLTITLISLLPVTAWAICPTGYALEFQGINYVDCGQDASFDITESLTISCWIKTTKASVADMVAKWDASVSDGDPKQLVYKLALNHFDSGEVNFCISNDGLTYTDCSISGNYNDGNWHHVTGTYDGNTIKLYIDGLLKNNVVYSGGIFSAPDENVYIGTEDEDVYAAPFDGIIDEVAIFDEALSAEEIKEVYCGNIDPCDSGLVGYWDFDEGTGQQAYDSTANSNDGQLGNSPSTDSQDPNWVLSDITPAPDYYVDDDWANDPGPGDPCVSDPCEDGSIDHPFDNIQEAIDTAYADCNTSCCPVILVRDGWYEGMGNYDIDTLGMDVTVKSEHGPWYTIIDPHGQGRGFTITNGETKCTLIDGFTIFDGYAKPVQLYGQSAIVGGGILCKSSSPTIRNCAIYYSYAKHSGGGIFLHDSNAVVERCEIIYNDAEEVTGGGIVIDAGNPVIRNCVIAQNTSYYAGGISCSSNSNVFITNCTLADNRANQWQGVRNLECVGGNAEVTNSILWTNTEQSIWCYLSCCLERCEPLLNIFEEHLLIEPWSGYPASLSISYSDLEWGMEAIYNPDTNATLDWQVGNINTYPLFADSFFADYHLKSGVGRWTFMYESNGDYNNDWVINFGDFAIFALYWMQPNPPVYIDLDNDGYLDVNDLEIFCSRWLGPGENFSGWVQDDSNSPCIDAGDPCSSYLLEPAPNGERVNMGAYGNTTQASKSTVVPVPRRHPDMDDDGDVDFVDFAYFAKWWLYVAPGIPADFDYSGFVNEADLQEFCLWWLWGK